MKRAALLMAALAGLLVAAGCKDNNESEEVRALNEAADAHIEYGKNGQASLKAAGSCAALEGELKALAAAEIRTWFERYDGTPQPATDDTNGVADGASAWESAPGPSDYTNNQVAGIDEADFVKTDGEQLFVLLADQLFRMKIPVAGEILPADSYALEGDGQALLMHGGRLLVVSGEYGGPVYAADASQNSLLYTYNPRVRITLLDWPLADSQPTLVSERWYDGSFLQGRLLDATARLVLHAHLPNPVIDAMWQETGEDASVEEALEELAALALDDLLPQRYTRGTDDELVAEALTEAECAAFEIPDDSNGGGVSSVVSLDLPSASVQTRSVLSNWPTVYMSEAHLYLAESAQEWWWYAWNEDEDEQLNLHAFEISNEGLQYLDSARMKGAPINQFALDEQDGVLRMATWTGGWRWWWTSESMESQLHTFSVDSDGIQPLGKIEGIAPGEQLYAARFVGDTAYLVTFEQIDPLFVVDLSDAAAPAMLGELEVPGFSTYLHPLDDNRLLAVGVGGDEQGVTWNTVVSLFDASNPAAPTLAAQHDFSYEDGDWNWTEAMYEHKAFQYHAGRGLLAVPVAASRNDNGAWQWISSLELVRVDGDTLTEAGSIDHSTYFSSQDDAFYQSPDIRRSFFIGDYIYAISGKAVSVHPADNPSVKVADALLQ